MSKPSLPKKKPNVVTITASEVQFHVLRLGNRQDVATLFRVNKDTLRKVSQRSDMERYMAGELVDIGGLLVRKCIACHTARTIDEFVSKSPNKSGCGNTCYRCRRANSLHKQYLRVRKSK